MNPLAWFQRGQKKSSTWDVFRSFFESEARAGPSTPAQAMKVATVFAIARVYGNGLAQVPMKLMLAQANGGGDPAREHKLYNIIALKPNAWQTSFQFRQTIGMHLAMANNAYVFKVLGPGGRILELLPFAPEHVSAKQTKDQVMQYRVRLIDGSFLDVDPALMWHLRNMSWDGVTGLDAVLMARNAIGLAESTEEHGRKFWSNGARVSGVLTSDQVLSEPQLEALRDSWRKAYGGTENSGKTAVLGMGMKYQPTAMQADHSQYAETRKMQAEEICRGFGVLPIMIGISDKATTYASAEAMYQAHVTNTLMPLYENVVQSAMVNLLTAEELREGYYFHLSANALLRGNSKDRGEFYYRLWQMGVINPNEIRALEEMNPREGGEAYYVPVNMTPSDKPLGSDTTESSKTEPTP